MEWREGFGAQCEEEYQRRREVQCKEWEAEEAEETIAAVTRRLEWRKLLGKLNLEADRVALDICETLGSLPEDIEPFREWFYVAIEAVRENIAARGKCSKTAAEFGWTHGLVRAAIRAHHRHQNTDYDDLLTAGYSRDVARAIMQEY